jgi:hypothetical protein
MRKWQQQFSVGYFIVALVLLFSLQSFFAHRLRGDQAIIDGRAPESSQFFVLLYGCAQRVGTAAP